MAENIWMCFFWESNGFQRFFLVDVSMVFWMFFVEHKVFKMI